MTDQDNWDSLRAGQRDFAMMSADAEAFLKNRTSLPVSMVGLLVVNLENQVKHIVSIAKNARYVFELESVTVACEVMISAIAKSYGRFMDGDRNGYPKLLQSIGKLSEAISGLASEYDNFQPNRVIR